MKRIIIIGLLLFMLTGCSCEYNLYIDNNYKENIIISPEGVNEKNLVNKKWTIPSDVDVYNNISDQVDTPNIIDGEIYDYKITGSKLYLEKEFTNYDINNSTAINECYDKVTITKYEGNIIISTSDEFKCFDKYDNFNSMRVNIITNGKVKSHNADNKSSNKYTWNINKNNKYKTINMIIVLEEEEIDSNASLDSNSNNSSSNNIGDIEEKKDYTLYVFCFILLFIVIVGYLIMKSISENSKKGDRI